MKQFTTKYRKPLPKYSRGRPVVAGFGAQSSPERRANTWHHKTIAGVRGCGHAIPVPGRAKIVKIYNNLQHFTTIYNKMPETPPKTQPGAPCSGRIRCAVESQAPRNNLASQNRRGGAGVPPHNTSSRHSNFTIFYNNLQQFTTVYNKKLENRERVFFSRKTGTKVFSKTIQRTTLSTEKKIVRAISAIFVVLYPQ